LVNNIFVDSDILLDLLLKRAPYYSSAAKSRGITCLVTRNKSDYQVTDIIICTAEEYLKIYHHSMNS